MTYADEHLMFIYYGHIWLRCLSSFFILAVLGFELGFTFAKQALYCLSHTSCPFCSGYFGDGFL
jgi:hypothetical protein